MSTRALSVLLVLPTLASCSFLLDFDSLQKGSGGSAGMGAGGGGGSAGAGVGAEGGTGALGPSGAGGGGECPATCFHDDPCLESGCDADGNCLTGKVTGLALDGVDKTIAANTHYRVTMIGGDSAFYLSSYATTAGKPEVTFYELDGTKRELTTLGTLGGLAIANTGDPVSAAGLAFQPVTGILHAFVALNDRVGSHARVWHIVLGTQDNLPKPTAIGSLTAGYFADSPYNYPNALYLDSKPYSAWINADQTVSLTDGTDLGTPSVLSAATKATTLSLISATDNTPAVVYTVAGGGVFVEKPSVAPVAVVECQPATGDYLSSSAAFTNIPGVWIDNFTKYAGDPNPFLTTNARGIACSADTCGGDMNPCPADSEDNLARNPAMVIVHAPGDPTSLMQVVEAASFISSDGTTATLVLTQQSTDLGSKPLQSMAKTTDLGPPIELASMPTSADASFRGPDWPAVAYVEPDKYAVAWTEPAANGDELRVRRYRMCPK
jgi:hypothetical protein